LRSKNKNGVYLATYPFKVNSDGLRCPQGSNCNGWYVSGEYTVTTNVDPVTKLPSSSSVLIKAKITAPHVISKKNIFATGFLFPHGTREQHTEVYMAKKSVFNKFVASKWKVTSLQSKDSARKIMRSPLSSWVKSKRGRAWKTYKLVEAGDEVDLIIRREFTVDNEPGFFLGTYRPWIIGFLDGEYERKVWTETMPLHLDSCYPVHHPESYSISNGFYSAKYNFEISPGQFNIKQTGHYIVSSDALTAMSTV